MSAEDLVASMRALADRGFTYGKGGAASERTSRGILVKPSGIEVDALRPDHFVLVDAKGGAIEGKRKPTGKLPLHLAIYAARPDVRAVLHAYPPHATALAAARVELAPCPDELQGVIGGAVRCSQYTYPETPEWGKAAVAALGDRAAALLANHGLVTVGRTPREALDIMVLVEAAARIHILSAAAGGAKPIPDDAARRFRNEYTLGIGLR